MQKSKEEMACIKYLETLKEPAFDKVVDAATHFKEGYKAASSEIALLKKKLEYAIGQRDSMIFNYCNAVYKFHPEPNIESFKKVCNENLEALTLESAE